MFRFLNKIIKSCKNVGYSKCKVYKCKLCKSYIYNGLFYQQTNLCSYCTGDLKNSRSPQSSSELLGVYSSSKSN